MRKCNQVACQNPPAFRFPWPSKDEAWICAIDAMKLRGIATAMGLHVQLVPLTTDDYLRDDEPEQAK